MTEHIWDIIDTGQNSASENMRFDAWALERADTFDKPVLHLYEWEAESATYGYFTQPSQFLDLERAARKNLCLARRPTGGGIIFHVWDMAFSVIVGAHLPEYSINTLENYAFVNSAVLGAAQEFLQKTSILSLIEEDGEELDRACHHFCMAKPTKYDVLWEGKKVAGSAQRKTKKGFLHQGSISLLLPPQDYLSDILLPGTAVAAAMQKVTCPLLGAHVSKRDIEEAKERLKKLLAIHLNRASLHCLSMH